MQYIVQGKRAPGDQLSQKNKKGGDRIPWVAPVGKKRKSQREGLVREGRGELLFGHA